MTKLDLWIGDQTAAENNILQLQVLSLLQPLPNTYLPATTDAPILYSLPPTLVLIGFFWTSVTHGKSKVKTNLHLPQTLNNVDTWVCSTLNFFIVVAFTFYTVKGQNFVGPCSIKHFLAKILYWPNDLYYILVTTLKILITRFEFLIKQFSWCTFFLAIRTHAASRP